eukprot:CAMPEP_0178962096 /NCGR_PEP_ID=MMETSP0789-20121207/14139_1 /TAXON_ID=3005 /ORGANISM="Rhizosolenia setigera, Strain CCMP 1694" /LENGTH=119 /DNA_ID=CAMNT_0020646137 /DNA_START=261 /DNA_END=620 /DNA_ORIENTATION=+
MNKRGAGITPVKRKSPPAFKSYANLHDITSKSYSSSTPTTFSSIRYNSSYSKRRDRVTINRNQCEIEIEVEIEIEIVDVRYEFQSRAMLPANCNVWEDDRMDVDKTLYDDDDSRMEIDE